MENLIQDRKGVDKIESLVRGIAIKEGFVNFELKIKAISTNGANYMGELYLIDVEEEGKETLNLFAKATNTPQKLRELIPANAIYKSEVFVYTSLADTFHDLQERHGIPEEMRFKFPKYYGSNLKEMEEVIVLENLTAQGYELFDRFKPIDWEYARASVEEIAKFHALSFALEKENPQLFEKLIKNCKNFGADSGEKMIETGNNMLQIALSAMEPDNYSYLKKFIDDNKSSFMNKIKVPSTYSVLAHNDFRMSNIMVKYEKGFVASLKPVDYQTSAYGNPLIDIMYFLFTGSDETFRRQYFDDYLEHYHNTLAKFLRLLSQDINTIYPKSAFYFEVKDKLIIGLEFALFILGIVLVDISQGFKLDDFAGSESNIKTTLKPNAMYTSRINGIVRDFIRWGYLKCEDESAKTPNSGIVPLNIERLINKIATKEGFKEFSLKSTVISTNGANFMGDLYLLDILEEGKETLKLFAKTANTPAHVRAIFPADKMYETEVFVYTTLADTYNSLQEKFGVPEEKRFKIPKYYGSDLENMDEVIILENLIARGFELHDRFKSMDWKYAKAAVEEIAKFHALSFALEKENPYLFNELIKKKRNNIGDNAEPMANTFQKVFPEALSAVEPEHRDKLKKYIDNHKHDFFSKLLNPTKSSVLIHGDYRISNIMVKYQDDQTITLVPVDYQTVSYGCPLVDILYFLFSGSDEEFRREHFEDYLEHYHNTLTESLKLLSHDIKYIYPRSKFYFDLEELLIVGLEISILTLGLIMQDPTEVATLEDMLSDKTSAKPNQMYAERLNGIVRDFVRWGYLKDEDITVNTSNLCLTNEDMQEKIEPKVHEDTSNKFDEKGPTSSSQKSSNDDCCKIL